MSGYQATALLQTEPRRAKYAHRAAAQQMPLDIERVVGSGMRVEDCAHQSS